MQIEIAPDANMAMDSRALLRSLQNDSTPRLDLFVREALQNSLDALQEGREAAIELQTGQLPTARVARHFEQIGGELIRRFGAQSPYLLLRDSGTVGLSGPIRYQDVHGDRGNLRKLVYEIARPKEETGAGGSWGYGKTVYFRMGIGLVIYYSRFRDATTGKFHSRLAATMIEDQSAPDPLLAAAGCAEPGSRGICWWGQLDPKYPGSGGTVPLTDEDEINAVLRDLGIAPYTGQATGTTVLIPFIGESELLQETANAPEDGGPDHAHRPYWHDNLEDYLEIAVQRWYAPRLGNARDFGSRALNLTLNGRKVELDPFFCLMQELYHAGKSGGGEFRGRQINVQDIKLNRVFAGRGTEAGRLSYISLPKSELGIGGPQHKLDPYTNAGLTVKPGKHAPLVAFTRQPGMIISYETSAPWVPSVQTDPQEYMIGLFVPKSERDLSDPAMPFEEYLRSAELADHMSWHDKLIGGKQRTIIKRIQEKVRKELREKIVKAERPIGEARTDLGLGRLLGQVFMPAEGFGGWDRGSGGAATGGGGVGGSGAGKSTESTARPRYSGKRISVKPAGEVIWNADSVTVPFRLDLGKHDGANVMLRVQTESGPVRPAVWEKQTGHSSPVEILQVEINRIYADRTLVADDTASVAQQIVLGELRTAEGTLYGFRVSDNKTNRRLSLDGLLTYRAKDAEGELAAEEAAAAPSVGEADA